MPKTQVRPPPAPDWFAAYAAGLEQLGLTLERWTAQQQDAAEPRADALIRLAGAWGHGEWWVELKRRLTAATLAPILHQLKTLQTGDRPVLLLADLVTTPMAEQLRANAIQFIDAAGNAFLEQRGLLVWVVGRRREGPVRAPRRDLHTAGLRLLFVLLQGQRDTWTHRALADEAGIALGGVGPILNEFAQRNWIRRTAADALVLHDPAQMLKRWDEGFAETLRPKLWLQACRRRPRTELADLATQIATAGLAERVLVGGELGAALLTDHLKPAAATLHLVDIDAKDVMRRLELVPDREGDVTLLRNVGRFTQPRAKPFTHVADPLLVRAELLVRHDDRLREIAELVRTEHIETRWR